jgi:hypothetical protein
MAQQNNNVTVWQLQKPTPSPPIRFDASLPRVAGVTNNPHSTADCPRFPPCQVYRRWMTRILQPQTFNKAAVGHTRRCCR